MEANGYSKTDFRAPSSAKHPPRAVADGLGGLIVAVADVYASRKEVFHALTTSQVEKWWKYPGLYDQKDWKADLRPYGPWSVTVEFAAGAAGASRAQASCINEIVPFSIEGCIPDDCDGRSRATAAHVLRAEDFAQHVFAAHAAPSSPFATGKMRGVPLIVATATQSIHFLDE